MSTTEGVDHLAMEIFMLSTGDWLLVSPANGRPLESGIWASREIALRVAELGARLMLASGKCKRATVFVDRAAILSLPDNS